MFVRVAGERWKEQILGGSLPEAETRFLTTGMNVVGREMKEVEVTEDLDDRDTGVGEIAHRPRRQPQHTADTMSRWQENLFEPLERGADQRIRLALVTD